MIRAVVVLLLAVSCAPNPEPPAKLWTMASFVKGRQPNAAGAPTTPTFGGLETTRLFVREGDVLPWRKEVAAKQGVPPWPGFSAGVPAAFIITDLWLNHPSPWVQPVYKPVPKLGADPFAFGGIFPVGTDTRFYSPFWRMRFVETPADTQAGRFKSASQLVALGTPQADGPMVLCPITGTDGAGEFSVAESATGVEHPLSKKSLAQLSLAHGFAEGVAVNYIDFGAYRFESSPDNADLPHEVPAYFFVMQQGEADAVTPLPLPVVMPDHPEHEALWRRHDVLLRAPMAVYVPPTSPLKTPLESAGVVTGFVTGSDAGVYAEYALRVVRDRACLSADAGFPASCEWVDSRAAVEALPAEQRKASTLLMAAGLLTVKP